MRLFITFGPLKTVKPYLSFALLMLFGITLLPVNFLHQHAEDEHGMVMHHAEQKDLHHCELDDLHCQPFTDHCDHDQHVSRTIAKCFSCEFHFIKQFIAGETTLAFSIPFYTPIYQAQQPAALLEALILLSNKGPPAA